MDGKRIFLQSYDVPHTLYIIKQKDGKTVKEIKVSAAEIPYTVDDNNFITAILEGDKDYSFLDFEGNVKMQGAYDKARTFQNGQCAVKLNKKWGMIDSTGNIILESKYEDIGVFSEGLCAVKENGKWGFVDTNGAVVINIPLRYLLTKAAISFMKTSSKKLI